MREYPANRFLRDSYEHTDGATGVAYWLDWNSIMYLPVVPLVLSVLHLVFSLERLEVVVLVLFAMVLLYENEYFHR